MQRQCPVIRLSVHARFIKTHDNINSVTVFLHIVTSCKVTLEMRNTFLEYIVDNFTPQFSIYVTDLEHEELLCFLLGRKSPQTQCLDTDEYNRLIMVSANYIVACCKQFYQGVLHN